MLNFTVIHLPVLSVRLWRRLGQGCGSAVLVRYAGAAVSPNNAAPDTCRQAALLVLLIAQSPKIKAAELSEEGGNPHYTRTLYLNVL